MEAEYDTASNLIGNNLLQIGGKEGTITSTFLSDSVVIGFPNSIISNDVGKKLNVGITGGDVEIINSNGGTTLTGTVLQHQSSAAWITTPRVEVHLNPAFDDDEGIAESGL